MITKTFEKMLLSRILVARILGRAKPEPITAYAGLMVSPAKPDGAGIAEIRGGGYARVVVSSWKWNSAGLNGANRDALRFRKATKSWGTVTHICLFDAADRGRLLAVTPLKAPKAVKRGEGLILAPGDLTLSID